MRCMSNRHGEREKNCNKELIFGVIDLESKQASVTVM